MKFFLSLIIMVSLLGCSDNKIDITSTCSGNASLEISELSLGFKLADIEKINILNGDKASAYLTFADNSLPDLSIITTDEKLATGNIQSRGGYEKLGVNSLLDIYQKADQGLFIDEYSKNVMKAMGMSNSDHIDIFEKPGAHIVVLQDAYGESVDNIYVIRANDPRIMMLSANMNTEQTDRLLDSICL